MYNDGLQQQQYLLQLQQQQLQQQRAGTNSPAREFTVVALGKSGEGKTKGLLSPFPLSGYSLNGRAIDDESAPSWTPNFLTPCRFTYP